MAIRALVLFHALAMVVGDGTFLLFSDFHYDPEYGTHLAYQARACGPGARPSGQYGCDSPPELVENVIAAASAAFPNPDFIVFAGDINRHGMVQLPNAKAVLNGIIANVSALFDKYFPNSSRFGSPAIETHASVFFALGNNDVVPNYNLEINPPNATNASVPMLRLIADAWAPELSRGEYSDLAFGGYYQREVVPGLTLLSINTLLYSVHHTPNSTGLADPDSQFRWLNSSLATIRARRGKACIVGHIPPTVTSCMCAGVPMTDLRR
jgi:sphingomyelin phosphodiesterase acid-like 3